MLFLLSFENLFECLDVRSSYSSPFSAIKLFIAALIRLLHNIQYLILCFIEFDEQRKWFRLTSYNDFKYNFIKFSTLFRFEFNSLNW